MHDALVPALMDGMITVELMEVRMHYYYEMCNTHQNFQPTSSIALPAHFPPRTIVCPNCKCGGHTIEFCVAPGGKMKGLSTFDAITRQRAAREASRTAPRHPDNTAGPSLHVDSDGSFWIGNVRYRPEKGASAALAEAPLTDVSPPSTPILVSGDFPDWNLGNVIETQLNTASTLLASSCITSTALLS